MGVIKQHDSEMILFDLIKDQVFKLIDIGCRTNIDYFNLKKDCEMHLFDINKNHIQEIKNKLNGIENNIHLYDFGLSNTNSTLTYSHLSESVKRIWGDNITCQVFNFSDILKKFNIINIDFLKMDIEGCEPEILSFHDIITSIKFIQFEYGNTWNLNEYDLKQCHNFYSQYFNIFFIRDYSHPISQENSSLLIPVDIGLVNKIDHYVSLNCGCNILMVKKNIKIDYENL